MQLSLWVQIDKNSDQANKLKRKLREALQGFGEYTIAVKKAHFDAQAQMQDLSFPNRDGPN
jgi:hypothetical protein